MRVLSFSVLNTLAVSPAIFYFAVLFLTDAQVGQLEVCLMCVCF